MTIEFEDGKVKENFLYWLKNIGLKDYFIAMDSGRHERVDKFVYEDDKIIGRGNVKPEDNNKHRVAAVRYMEKGDHFNWEDFFNKVKK